MTDFRDWINDLLKGLLKGQEVKQIDLLKKLESIINPNSTIDPILKFMLLNMAEAKKHACKDCLYLSDKITCTKFNRFISVDDAETKKCKYFVTFE